MTANSKYSHSTEISAILRNVVNMLTRELLADETKNSLVERLEQVNNKNKYLPPIVIGFFVNSFHFQELNQRQPNPAI